MEIFLPMNIRNKLIVQNIRSFAQIRGTSIKQIEKDLGLGNGMIGKWEDSKKSPPVETIEVIANYWGASILELAGITPSENEKAPATEGEGEKDALIKAVREITDKDTALAVFDELSKKMRELM